MGNVKVYSQDGENSETVNTSVLQIISKGQGIEMSSSGVFPTKKYYNSVDFQKYPSKVLTKTTATTASQSNNLSQEMAQQKLKQQLLERELKLQKSLSEECEDLGVDEPSTSDLFPEADLLFDTNHSPAFDNSSQEASCSQNVVKSFSNTTNTTFFEEASPVVPAKKKPAPRRPAKPTQPKRKRNSDGLQTANAKKQKLSQDEVASSNAGENETTSQKVKNVIKSFCQIRVRRIVRFFLVCALECV